MRGPGEKGTGRLVGIRPLHPLIEDRPHRLRLGFGRKRETVGEASQHGGVLVFPALADHGLKEGNVFEAHIALKPLGAGRKDLGFPVGLEDLVAGLRLVLRDLTGQPHAGEEEGAQLLVYGVDIAADVIQFSHSRSPPDTGR